MTRRILLGCGVVSSVLYLVAIDVLAPIAQPEYHRYTSQMVSELFALGAPTRAHLVLPMLLYNALVFAFAAGVWAAAGPRQSLPRGVRFRPRRSQRLRCCEFDSRRQMAGRWARGEEPQERRNRPGRARTTLAVSCQPPPTLSIASARRLVSLTSTQRGT